jgi:shikimate 5-dehydrogenase/shikimate kinase
MIYAVVGHRGVGKTTFLERVRGYYQALNLTCHTFDLDKEIEKRTGRNIKDIFATDGEATFRQYEEKYFNEIYRECSAQAGVKYIAVGAGFQAALPSPLRVLWLRRASDSRGRIFADRPRLNAKVSPLQEYLERYESRDAGCRAIYQKEISMAEGWGESNPFEPVLLGLKPAQLNFSVTIMPEHIANEIRENEFINEMVALGVKYFELRDDLLSEEKILELVKKIPTEKVLISFRKAFTSQNLIRLSGPYATDWASELGPSPLSHNTIISLHKRKAGESIDEAAERLLKHKADHYKFSPDVNSFVELWAAHRFYSDDPKNRSFLPRSTDGRWSWYRLSQNHRMHLSFARRGDGSSFDQPLIFDLLRYPKEAAKFAAVLGDPVIMSHTPAEQGAFFAQKSMGVLAIRLSEEDCNSLTMSILERLGLRAAAVTSPLKKKIIEVCSSVDHKAAQLGAVNTIVLTKDGWSATNTDIDGVKKMFSVVDMPENVAVWGGGGMRELLRNVLPGAHFFSARRGEEIWIEDDKSLQAQAKSPEVVVWALGRSRQAGTQPPPAEWRPKYILDLNYSDDSPGLEYAVQSDSKYISGKSMFKTQAKVQRDFWQNSNFE